MFLSSAMAPHSEMSSSKLYENTLSYFLRKHETNGFLEGTPFCFLRSLPFGTAGNEETICRRALIFFCLFSPLQRWAVILPKLLCSSLAEAAMQAQVDKSSHLFLPKNQDMPRKIQNAFWVQPVIFLITHFIFRSKPLPILHVKLCTCIMN